MKKSLADHLYFCELAKNKNICIRHPHDNAEKCLSMGCPLYWLLVDWSRSDAANSHHLRGLAISTSIARDTPRNSRVKSVKNVDSFGFLTAIEEKRILCFQSSYLVISLRNSNISEAASMKNLLLIKLYLVLTIGSIWAAEYSYSYYFGDHRHTSSSLDCWPCTSRRRI